MDSILTDNITRVSVETTTRLMKLLFRYVPTITDYNEMDMLTSEILDLSRLAGALESEYADNFIGDMNAKNLTDASFINTISKLITRLKDYMKIMSSKSVFDKQYKDRLTASKSAIKSVGFDKVIGDIGKEALSTIKLEEDMAEEEMGPDYERFQLRRGEGRTKTDLEGGRKRRKRVGKIEHSDEKLLALQGREAQTKMILDSTKTKKGRFTPKPLRREDEERLGEGQRLGDGRDMLTRDERQNYGDKSGEFYDLYAEGKGEVAQTGGRLPKDRLSLIRKRK